MTSFNVCHNPCVKSLFINCSLPILYMRKQVQRVQVIAQYNRVVIGSRLEIKFMTDNHEHSFLHWHISP
jgi:hypothetical protein